MKVMVAAMLKMLLVSLVDLDRPGFRRRDRCEKAQGESHQYDGKHLYSLDEYVYDPTDRLSI